MEESIKILIADENYDFRTSCRDNLSRQGFKQIDFASNGEDALNKIRIIRPDVVIIDAWLSKLDSVKVINNVKDMDNPPSFIVVSIVNNQNIFSEATEAGAEYCLVKPLDFSSLKERIIRISAKNRFNKNDAFTYKIPANQVDIETQITKIILKSEFPHT